MSQQLLSEHNAPIVQRVHPFVPLSDDDEVAIEVASALRQRSRDLRATSKTLRSKNLEVVKRANAVTLRYYDLILRLS